MKVTCYRRTCTDPKCPGPHWRDDAPPELRRRPVGPVWAGPVEGPVTARTYIRDWWAGRDLCWCGCPQDALATIGQALALHPRGDVRRRNVHEWDELWERRREWLNDDGHLLTALVLDAWDLTEHGSSIYGAWLTVEGERLLAAIRTFGEDADDLYAVFHDEVDPP